MTLGIKRLYFRQFNSQQKNQINSKLSPVDDIIQNINENKKNLDKTINNQNHINNNVSVKNKIYINKIEFKNNKFIYYLKFIKY